MSTWAQHMREAPARLGRIERAADVRALYDALCTVADTLSAFQAQPRFTVAATGTHNAAGECLDAMRLRAEADIAGLVEIASAGVDRPLSRANRDNLNWVLLHYEARSGQPPDEIAAMAATLALKGERGGRVDHRTREMGAAAMTAVRRAQLAFALAEWAADIGDDDFEAQGPYYGAMAVLVETHPADLAEAAARLQFLLCVGERYADCALVRAAMIQVAAWLALSVSAGQRRNVENEDIDALPVSGGASSVAEPMCPKSRFPEFREVAHA